MCKAGRSDFMEPMIQGGNIPHHERLWGAGKAVGNRTGEGLGSGRG